MNIFELRKTWIGTVKYNWRYDVIEDSKIIATARSRQEYNGCYLTKEKKMAQFVELIAPNLYSGIIPGQHSIAITFEILRDKPLIISLIKSF